MNWLDLGLILFAIILLVIGIKKGFMTSVISHFSFTINAILSFFLCKPISLFYNKVFNLHGAIASSYAERMLEASANFGTNLLELSKGELSGFVRSTIKEGGFNGISRGFFNLFINKPTLYNELHSSNHTSRTLADIISSSYGTFFVTIISFVTSVLLLYLLVFLFRLLVKKLREVGFVKTVDTVLGAFYGLFRCFIVLVGICLVIKLFSPLSFMQSVTNYISESFFGKLIYNQINSFFDNYLSFKDIISLIFKK
ncbi:MAG: CvpA family protein [Clostridia bacterium]|nr:CvpA family protein [Clostridia bacterium]